LLQSEIDIADGSGYSENRWQINLKRGKDGVRLLRMPYRKLCNGVGQASIEAWLG
jgi:hypothetical protein